MFYYVDTYAYGIGVALAIMIACVAVIVVSLRSQSLNNKFVKLGDMTGKSLSEIEAAAGPANEYLRKTDKNTGEPLTIATWSKGKYQIVIMFESENIFNHIVSQGRY